MSNIGIIAIEFLIINMVAKVKTFAFIGIKAVEVDVQVKISPGKPAFSIVGLPDKAIGESKERIRSAILSMGLEFPYKRITVNLAPADLIKEGSHYDLAIAIGLLIELGVLSQSSLEKYYCLGELSLDGFISKVGGVLPASIEANSLKCGIICPELSAVEAVMSGNDDVIAPSNLIAIINHFKNSQFIPKVSIDDIKKDEIIYPDLKDIKGQEFAKRALEVAAAGGHNLLMIGPPGTGKSMLASRMPGIMPDLTLEEKLEINMIHSIGGKIDNESLIHVRPFRDPHHSCSMPAMVGGGSRAKPGEISLAHNGVLFLDELAEFPAGILDSLRQPIENGNILISRVNSHVEFPANFQLIGAMNPCRCGYFSDSSKSCNKYPKCAINYQSRISGPLLDRMDIIIEVAPIDIFDQEFLKEGESSKEIAKRVRNARKIQSQRYVNKISMNHMAVKTNAKAKEDAIKESLYLDDQSQEIIKKYMKNKKISMRSYSRILRVARTIADLDNNEKIHQNHLIEAIKYKNMTNLAHMSQ